MDQRRPVMLCILDGWGNGPATPNNAITETSTPRFDAMIGCGPVAELMTSAEDVGLPSGQMGNSEVGHQNLGAGRVVLQDLPRIDKAVADDAIAALPEMIDFVGKLQATGGTCHLLGLLSPGGVHSHQDHLVALAKILDKAGIPVAFHVFMDGRDTPPRAGLDYAAQFLDGLKEYTQVYIATVCGRYFAMDRDQRWDRVERAYNALAQAEGVACDNLLSAISQCYDRDVGDEFIEPAVIGDYAGMRDGDGLLMANFRADRAREILAALVDPAFDGFKRRRPVEFAARLGMVSYSSHLDHFFPVLFSAEDLKNTLGAVVSEAGFRQLRIAETEKYAHVTFFLNGGSEEIFEGEERILVPSPKVATYDLQPEMSAGEVTDELVAAIRAQRFELIVVNYANPDMVGHTGNLAAAVKAVAYVDQCLGRLEDALKEVGGVMLVTADHGNIEQMWDPETNGDHTAHTTNPVPLVLVNGPEGVSLQSGRLADVAPTLLHLLNLPIPSEMTGTCLISNTSTPPSNGHKEERQNVHA